MRCIAGNRHITQAIKPIKNDTELFLEKSFVVLLKLMLRRREVRADRIISQIQYQSALRLPVAQLVEDLQRLNAQFKRTLSPLSINVLLRVARQGTNQFYSMAPKKSRQIILPRLKNYRQIATIHDMTPKTNRRLYQIVKARIELRCAAGNIHCRDVRTLKKTQHRIDGFPTH